MIFVKFDDIPATNSNNSKEGKSFFIPVLIIVIVFVVILIAYSVSSSKDAEVTPLDVKGRLVQNLYTSVHDFKSSSPYWMYEGENSSSISNMTEPNKMVLAYLNLKASDFLVADNCSTLPQTSYYGNLVCNDKTVIKREDVERSYKEVFGDNATLNTTVNMRVDPNYDVYVYNSELDSYILYSSAPADAQRFNKAFRYSYEIYQAEKVGNTIRIYEKLTVERVSNGNIENESKYLYTFTLAEDNLYSYTSIEKIVS